MQGKKGQERRVEGWVMDREVLAVSVAILVVGIGGAFGVTWTACLTASSCIDSGMCHGVPSHSSRYLPNCNFRRVPVELGAVDYLPLWGDEGENATAPSTNESTSPSIDLDSALRAYCAPGERVQSYPNPSDANQEVTLCMPQYTYPNSLSDEIGKSTGSTYSERYCGAWMDAAPSSMDPYDAWYWHAEGLAIEIDSIRKSSLATVTSSLARTQIGKVAEKCEHTLLAGEAAVVASAQYSYAYLISETGLASSTPVMTSLGRLTGHYCDGPVTIGWNYQSWSGGAFVGTMYDGYRFSDHSMSEALWIVGEPSSVIEAAVTANREVNANSDADASVAVPSDATLRAVYEGASGRQMPEGMPLWHEGAKELYGFEKLVERETSSDPTHRLSRAYLRGLAATCAFVAGDVMQYAGYTAKTTNANAGRTDSLARDLRERRRSRPAVSALGRLSEVPRAAGPAGRRAARSTEPMAEVDNQTMRDATSATLSQIVLGHILSGTNTVSESTVCAAYVSAVFPDAVDAERFSIVYTPKLYHNLERITDRVRRGVSEAIRTHPALANVLDDPAAVADDVTITKLRIPGAPRGTWAATRRPLPASVYSSDDSFLTMVLKQARAVFLDRQSALVYDETDVCEGPAVFDSMVANAYIFPRVHCAYYLLGLSMRPFSDETFDDESMLSRIGYIIAHEFSHSTMNTGWDEGNLTSLLSRYHVSTYGEALADVVAGVGLLHSNTFAEPKLNASRLCGHVCQTWCAQTGRMYASVQFGVHPMANRRGNFFCQTVLEDLGYLAG